MSRRHLPLAPARAEDDRAHLRADCSRCAGLCCVGPAFTASADFAFDKPAGQACRHLGEDFRCGIHDRLRGSGMTGCTVFDCFGAGQRITQQTFGGRTWREPADLASSMFAALPVMRQLHEMLWYLTEAAELPLRDWLRDDAVTARERVEAAACGSPAQLRDVDVAGLRREVGDLLEQVSMAMRATVAGRGRDRRGADLVGRDLRRMNLRGAGLRGAHLIGADLRGVDLHRTDLLGADLRAADVRGADLSTSLFLTQPQVTAALGDASTRLPPAVTSPAHWQ